jgi:hypothetical protein
MAAIAGDPEVPDTDELVRQVSDPDGVYGIPAEAVLDTITTAGVDEIADLIRGHTAAGADRIIFSIVAGDWHTQLTLAAQAVALAHS